MVLIAIVGGLGSGKTLCLTYMGLKYYSQGFQLYSNYDIKNPTTGLPLSDYIQSDTDLERVKDGYFLADELWNWCDSRMSSASANRFISGLLLKSRKRGFSLVYTTQSMGQIDKRVRDNTDFIIVPCINLVYGGKKIKIQQSLLEPVSLKPFWEYSQVQAFVFSANEVLLDEFEFRAADIGQFYNTNEEIEKLIQGQNNGITFEGNAGKKWEKNGSELEHTFNDWLSSYMDEVEWLSEHRQKSEYDHFARKDGMGFYFDVKSFASGPEGVTLNTKNDNWPTKTLWIKEYGEKPCMGGYLAFTEDTGKNWRFIKIKPGLPRGGITLGPKWRDRLLTIDAVLNKAQDVHTENELRDIEVD